MIGKSDDANLILAAPDEAQYEQWKQEISLCFTITEARRRKSVLVAAPIEVEPPKEAAVKVDEKLELPAPSAAFAIEEENPKEIPKVDHVEKVPIDSVPKVTPAVEPIKPPAVEDDVPAKEEKLSEEDPSLGSVEDDKNVKIPVSDLPGGFKPPSEDILSATLEKMGKRKSFKPPKKLGNLLNSKGFQDHGKEENGQSGEEKLGESNEEIVVDEKPSGNEPESVKAPPKPRELIISVRPTSPVREGYLFKLDTSPKEAGEDPWISQFISLEIATGEFQISAELGG
jgi:hypothetical protein